MAYVNTVLGPIHPEEMGTTAMHEHILWGLPGWDYDPGFWFKIGTAFEECYKQLMDYKLRGGHTYVDCSPIGMGRDLDIYVKLAASTRVHIVACTGFGADEGMPPYFRAKDSHYFEELFVRELTQGMGHTQVKAGLIRVGNSRESITESEEMRYRAAARAARRTGAAVVAEGGRFALQQLEILTSEKLDPSRVVISHLDNGDCPDLERDKQVARSGAYAAYDHVGLEGWSQMPERLPDERRAEIVLAMVEAGLQDRILLSTNAKCQLLGRGEPSLHNVTHVLRYFLPRLKQAGLSQEILNGILVDNPKRVLPIQSLNGD
jgi:phosphotriesterase-related protein